MDIDTMLALADHAIHEGNPQAACEFYEAALKVKPHHVDVLEAYGEVLLHHMQQPDRAQQFLRHAIQVAPDEGYVKYLNLAQLSEGAEALRLFQEARRVLQADLGRDADLVSDAARVEATLLSAAGELYLTDLCDEVDAEVQCEALLTRAVAVCDSSIEAHQALGSLRVTQLRMSEATSELRRAVDLTHELGEEVQPGLESKVELGKLLMQVSPPDAFNFLLFVLQLDPSNAYVWFLLGETARLRQRYHDAARLLKHARFSVEPTAAEAVAEIDTAIRVLIEEMGGPAVAAQVPHMDEANPLQFLEPEDDAPGEEDEDEDECVGHDD